MKLILFLFALFPIFVSSSLPCEGPSDTPCGGGCWNQNEGRNHRYCKAVGLGFYSPPNNDARYTCEMGRYSNTMDAWKCRLCAPGTYSSAEGASYCHYCSNGSFSVNSGSRSCDECDPTYYDGPGSDLAEVNLKFGPNPFCYPPEFRPEINPTDAPTAQPSPNSSSLANPELADERGSSPPGAAITASPKNSLSSNNNHTTSTPTDRPTNFDTLQPTLRRPTDPANKRPTRLDTLQPTLRRSRSPAQNPYASSNPSLPSLFAAPESTTAVPTLVSSQMKLPTISFSDTFFNDDDDNKAHYNSDDDEAHGSDVLLLYGPLLGFVIVAAAFTLCIKKTCRRKPKTAEIYPTTSEIA